MTSMSASGQTVDLPHAEQSGFLRQHFEPSRGLSSQLSDGASVDRSSAKSRSMQRLIPELRQRGVLARAVPQLTVESSVPSHGPNLDGVHGAAVEIESIHSK